ncbi:hypothetical protein M569_15861 [Genlisea aurea]|uniref:Uncharacterized protein n=1 Tax=Genlisea aurea TaxID=192259 RepID=S8C3K7_9LAMI|nr:hypothetical protein M569_15861 [Genlisea aurea]
MPSGVEEYEFGEINRRGRRTTPLVPQIVRWFSKTVAEKKTSRQSYGSGIPYLLFSLWWAGAGLTRSLTL